MPHRDSSYDRCVSPEDGRPIKLSVWVPLVDATLDNGCMYVLPKNCDALFDKPHDRFHMRPVEPPEKDGASFLGAAAANVKSRGERRQANGVPLSGAFGSAATRAGGIRRGLDGKPRTLGGKLRAARRC